MMKTALGATFDVDRDLFAFTSRFMEMSNGAKVHYVDEGKGDVTFLMLHGNPTWSFLYRKLISGLASDHRCVALDYPGFGLSTAPAGFDFTAASHYKVVAEFVERLELEHVILVVQDWGGPIGFALASEHPNLVTCVVLGNTWAWPLRGDRRMEQFSAIMGGPVGRVMARTFNGVWRLFMMRGFRRKPARNVMAMYAAPFRTGDRIQTSIFPRELIKAVELEQQAEHGLESLRDRPALLLWGTKDFAFKDTERRRFEDAFADPRTVLLDASHFWQEDQPDVAVHEIRQWLRGLCLREPITANPAAITLDNPGSSGARLVAGGALQVVHSEPRLLEEKVEGR